MGVFQQESAAQQARDALRGEGVTDPQLSVVSPTLGAGDVQAQLSSMGVPDGESRFYADQVKAGQTLLIVNANGNYGHARDVLLQYGATDVESQGEDLARAEGAGSRGGAGARPIDVTGRWEDVRSRYEMLFGQHYGTTDTEWPDIEPVYRWAWQAANEPRYRGRPWSEVERTLATAWQGSPAWDEVKGAVQDVWEDVAEEATTGAEGGQDRRIPRQGADQVGPARDVLPQSNVP